MLNGLFTWNWRLWYKINTLTGFTVATVCAMVSFEVAVLPTILYSFVYACLWGLTYTNEKL